MKKTCALLIVLCVLIGCVGCAVIESDTNQKAFPKDSHDVPFILYFDSTSQFIRSDPFILSRHLSCCCSFPLRLIALTTAI